MTESQTAEKRQAVLAILEGARTISEDQRAELRKRLKVDNDLKVARIDTDQLQAQVDRLNQLRDGEEWLLPGRLVSFADDTIRIEIGPQMIELDCTDENLSDTVTHPGYRIGGQDALGRMIRPDEAGIKPGKIKAHSLRTGRSPIKKGEKMAVIDFRAKLVPHLWKVYQLQDTDDPALNGYDEDGEPNIVARFIKVDEREGFEDALAAARELVASAGES